MLGVSLKLYLDIAQTVRWAHEVAQLARRHPAVVRGTVQLFVMPSFPALAPVREAIRGSRVLLGAQDLHWHDRGPYTGAVSGADLRSIGCRLVEVGHAERRLHFGEDDATVARKVAAAYRNGLTPVLCIGEIEQTGPGRAARECVARLDASLDRLDGLHAGHELIVAYEPGWAIGRSAAADPAHVTAVVAEIRDRLRAEHPLAGSRVIYGGSAQPGSLERLAPHVDGLFLGRYAHDPAQLARIVDEAASVA